MQSRKVIFQNCNDESSHHVLSRVHYGSVAVVETSYPAGHVVLTHSHASAHLGMVLSGKCSHAVRKETEEACLPGELHYLPASEPHSITFHSNARCLFIDIGHALLKRFKDYSNAELKPGMQTGGALYGIGRRLILESRRHDAASGLAMECLVLEALVQMSRRTLTRRSGSSSAVARARDLIRDRMHDRLKLNQIAHDVQMHPAHLAREFRRAFHCTMGQYLRDVRTQKALELITDTDTPLIEIGQLCGFFDQSHFSRCFAQTLGVSPLAFKKRCRN